MSDNKELLIHPRHQITYAGCDVKIFADLNFMSETFSDVNFMQIGEAHTISYSVYRDKQPVNRLGDTSPNGFTRGYVTIAGTIIFTVFHEMVLKELIEKINKGAKSLKSEGEWRTKENGDVFKEPNEYDITLSPSDLKYFRIDELPPLDIFVDFQNEYGDASRIAIYGVEFINEGQVMSVQDLVTENSVTFVARDISPMRRVNDFNIDADGYRKVRAGSWQAPGKEDYKAARDRIDETKKRWL